MSEHGEKGTIKTRSGTWNWELTSLRAWPKSDVTGKRLGFEDPDNAVNRMSLELEPDDAEITEKEILELSLVPRKRRFEDKSGTVWIAHPVEEPRPKGDKSAGKVSLHSLGHDSKVVELPPGRKLGDMKNEELAALV